MKRLQGRTALVTGGAGGIGAAAAKRLAREGARVVVADRDQQGLDRTVSELAGAGMSASGILYDQRSPESIAEMFDEMRSANKRLDLCFVNAGLGRYGEFLSLPLSDWQCHMDINLTGSFVVAQRAASWMAEQGGGGSIVFNASTAAAYQCDLFSAYAVSKSGLLMLARSMASELGSFRIRVNAILPGVTETAMTSGMLGRPGYAETVAAETPLGRSGTADDIAAAVAFLASDDGAFITGTTLVIDGGQSLHGYPRWFAADYRQAGKPEWHPYLASN